MNSIRAFCTRHRRTLLGLLFLSAFSLTITYAIPPISSYNPGETLDPSCAPGDPNCTVTIFPDQATHAGQYLTTDGSGVSWASVAGGGNTLYTGNGALTGDRSVDITGHSLSIAGDGAVLQMGSTSTFLGNGASYLDLEGPFNFFDLASFAGGSAEILGSSGNIQYMTSGNQTFTGNSFFVSGTAASLNLNSDTFNGTIDISDGTADTSLTLSGDSGGNNISFGLNAADGTGYGAGIGGIANGVNSYI